MVPFQRRDAHKYPHFNFYAEPMCALNTRVAIQGLKTATQHNGKQGTATAVIGESNRVGHLCRCTVFMFFL